MSTKRFVALAEAIIERLADYSCGPDSSGLEFWRCLYPLTAELEKERLWAWQWPAESAHAKRPAMLCLTVKANGQDRPDCMATPLSSAGLLPNDILCAGKIILNDPRSDDVSLYTLWSIPFPNAMRESEGSTTDGAVSPEPIDEIAWKAKCVLYEWIIEARRYDEQGIVPVPSSNEESESTRSYLHLEFDGLVVRRYEKATSLSENELKLVQAMHTAAEQGIHCSWAEQNLESGRPYFYQLRADANKRLGELSVTIEQHRKKGFWYLKDDAS